MDSGARAKITQDLLHTSFSRTTSSLRPCDAVCARGRGVSSPRRHYHRCDLHRCRRSRERWRSRTRRSRLTRHRVGASCVCLSGAISFSTALRHHRGCRDLRLSHQSYDCRPWPSRRQSRYGRLPSAPDDGGAGRDCDVPTLLLLPLSIHKQPSTVMLCLRKRECRDAAAVQFGPRDVRRTGRVTAARTPSAPLPCIAPRAQRS